MRFRIPRFINWPILMIGVAAGVVALCLKGCAVPVRPIAKIVPDGRGGAYFAPDPVNEPSVASFIPDSLPTILASCGGIGTVLGGILAVIKAREAKRNRDDADEGWDHALDCAKKMPPPKETP